MLKQNRSRKSQLDIMPEGMKSFAWRRSDLQNDPWKFLYACRQVILFGDGFLLRFHLNRGRWFLLNW